MIPGAFVFWMNMDILKIIFEHDLTLEHLSDNDDPRNRQKKQGDDNRDRERDHDSERAALKTFLAPQKTYSRYYFTGTRIRENRFGLSTLQAWPLIGSLMGRMLKTADSGHQEQFINELHEVTQKARSPDQPLDKLLSHLPAAYPCHNTAGSTFPDLYRAADNLKPYDVLISGSGSDNRHRELMKLDDRTGIRERFRPLSALLDKGHFVLLAEKAHHGFDLHLFSPQNIYEMVFHICQAVISPALRAFTINGKRVNSERHFYFETWTLDRPPHGFQEVTVDSRLR